MGTQGEVCFKRPAVHEETERDSVGGLVRSLVHLHEDQHQAAVSHDSDVEEIVVDVDVDGSRYLLVRLPVVSRSQIILSPRELEIARMVA